MKSGYRETDANNNNRYFFRITNSTYLRADLVSHNWLLVGQEIFQISFDLYSSTLITNIFWITESLKPSPSLSPYLQSLVQIWPRSIWRSSAESPEKHQEMTAKKVASWIGLLHKLNITHEEAVTWFTEVNKIISKIL